MNRDDEEPKWVKGLELRLLNSLQELMAESIKAEVKKAVTSHVGKVTEALTEIRNENLKLKEEIRELCKEAQGMNRRCLVLESHSRRANIELHNIPYEPEEKLDDVIKSIASKIPGLKSLASPGTVLKIHRSGRPKMLDEQLIVPPVVAELRNRQFAEDVIKTAKAYFRAGEKLYGADLVTSGQHKPVGIVRQYAPLTKRLYGQARKVAMEKKYKYTWITESGTILVRKKEGDKAIRIDSAEDLDRLK